MVMNYEARNMIERLKERSEDRATHDERLIAEAADLLEKLGERLATIYSQPVELPEAVAYQSSLEWRLNHLMSRRQYDSCLPKNRVDFDVPLYTADQLTKAVQEATARALEAAARECEARYMGDNNREDMEARRCADAIRNLIGNVPLRGVK